MEKEAIQEELYKKGISDLTVANRTLSGMTAKAEQNMENMVCNNILNGINNSSTHISQISGYQQDLPYNENEDTILKKW
jgi:hypothetical protein